MFWFPISLFNVDTSLNLVGFRINIEVNSYFNGTTHHFEYKNNLGGKEQTNKVVIPSFFANTYMIGATTASYVYSK
ncbi:hypothetical protein [Mesoplasma chauliocola]|uniref:hypothetical protein n=1 Tax=Mesoplasma chauliocola TaxID=216427 RepID=UPI0012EC9CD2|nr:hypothetical protein [Mesoplasma chauliocola]